MEFEVYFNAEYLYFYFSKNVFLQTTYMKK